MIDLWSSHRIEVYAEPTYNNLLEIPRSCEMNSIIRLLLHVVNYIYYYTTTYIIIDVYI